MQATPDPRAEWQDALLAARLLCVAGKELGGVHLRAGSGPVRQAWLDCFAALSGADQIISVPVSSSMDRLCGGLDVNATLATGKMEIQSGLLAKANGGFVAIAGAERLEANAVGAIASALDLKTVEPVFGGFGNAEASQFSLIAIDESAPGDNGLALSLKERLALNIGLDGISWSAVNLRNVTIKPEPAQDIHAVKISDTWIEVAIKALSSPSPRRLFLTLNIAKALASLERRKEVSLRDMLTAIRLSGHSAEELEQQQQEEQAQQEAQQEHDKRDQQPKSQSDRLPDDMIVNAALADISGIELAINAVRANSRLSGNHGTSGERRNKARRGRVLSVRERPPFPDARPDVAATLRAAAPWQLIRRAERAAKGLAPLDRVILQTSDFRYRHFQDRRESAVIFAVDASGSTAMDRLGEAKGAVE
ncbi:MAG: hypothetical protein ACRCT6_03730, partial [Notoacmeibacter sp.]